MLPLPGETDRNTRRLDEHEFKKIVLGRAENVLLGEAFNLNDTRGQWAVQQIEKWKELSAKNKAGVHLAQNEPARDARLAGGDGTNIRRGTLIIMRQIKRRVAIPKGVRDRLDQQKKKLTTLKEPAKFCEQRFNSARKANWFTPVRIALKNMAGATETCMFCDHNEPTDVEHFRPKAAFPRQTFSWGKMLWICTTCNRIKGTRFPPRNCAGAPLGLGVSIPPV